MPSAGTIILVLKIAVVAVTVLLAGSLTALWYGRYKLHGRINIVFFVLTLTALLGLEIIARILDPDLFQDHFERHQAKTALWIHLAFSMPAAALLLAMLPSGLRHFRRLHIGMGVVFLGLWIGTFVTGVFFLPHEPSPTVGPNPIAKPAEDK